MENVLLIQNQNFIQQALPVFAGALAAFLLSLVAFLIRNSLSRKSQKRQVLNNMARELRYNLTVLDDIKKEITKAIPKILSGDIDPYMKLKYERFYKIFTQEAYANGYLFEELGEYDFSVFDDLLYEYGHTERENYLRSRLSELKAQAINQEEVIRTFQYAIDDIASHVRIIGDVLNKIEEND